MLKIELLVNLQGALHKDYLMVINELSFGEDLNANI